MIELLKTSTLSEDDFQYIEDYDTYRVGVENYDEKIWNEARRETQKEVQAAQEKARLEKKHIVKSMRLKGYSAEDISYITDMNLSDVYAFFKELDKEK
jgi:ribosomal protein L3